MITYRLVNMMMKIVLTLLFVCSHIVNADDNANLSPDWFYPADGSEDWPGTCRGRKQSPIDISDYDIEITNCPEIKLNNYEKLVKFKSQNNGHTVTLNVDHSDDLHISGGNLKGKYVLQQFHFHWKSEHRFNGKQYPLEVHFVHVLHEHRERRHADINEDGAIHVLAVLYYINKNSNKALTNLLQSIKEVSEVGATDVLEFSPRLLLPMNLAEFYQYEGSLTTPNCNEAVQWTVFESKVPISREQYDIITSTETFNGSHSINYRNTQPLNNRTLKLMYVQSNSMSLQSHRSAYFFALTISIYSIFLI